MDIEQMSEQVANYDYKKVCQVSFHHYDPFLCAAQDAQRSLEVTNKSYVFRELKAAGATQQQTSLHPVHLVKGPLQFKQGQTSYPEPQECGLMLAVLNSINCVMLEHLEAFDLTDRESQTRDEILLLIAKQAMDITLDLDDCRLYWVMRPNFDLELKTEIRKTSVPSNVSGEEVEIPVCLLKLIFKIEPSLVGSHKFQNLAHYVLSIPFGLARIMMLNRQTGEERIELPVFHLDGGAKAYGLIPVDQPDIDDVGVPEATAH